MIILFKVIDQDVWWHLKAGELMWKAKGLIGTEPFSATLAGRPYAPIHEWLAQILLYLVQNLAGWNGLILLRISLVSLAFLLILAIDRRDIWPNGILIVFAALSQRPSYLDRPQLFTYALFAFVLFQATRYLRSKENWSRSHVLLWGTSLVIAQILWVNMHGAAAIFGVAIIGALVAQVFWNQWKTKIGRKSEILFLIGLFILVLLSLLLSPLGIRNLTDLYTYSTDATIALVREWQPRIWLDLAENILPFGIISLIIILATRRNIIFSMLIWWMTGAMALQSYRHGIIFVLASCGLAFGALRQSDAYEAIVDFFAKRLPMAIAATIALFGIFFLVLHRDTFQQINRLGYGGFGVHAPAAGAIAFIEREQLQGPFFNTYNRGAELLFSFAPQRKIFVDGRNVEYGFPFLDTVLKSGTDPSLFAKLEQQYGFTIAIIDNQQTNDHRLGYSSHLGTNPHWFLVALDDGTAVYVRDVPAHQKLIQTSAYRTITAENLEFGTILDTVSVTNKQEIEKELRRLVQESPDSIKSRLVLAQFYLQEKQMEQARIIAEETVLRHPDRPEGFAILAQYLASTGSAEGAAGAIDNALSLTAGNLQMTGLSPKFVAQVFRGIGDERRAREYGAQ
ncbi:MAG: tetratricopeptide repeat protein [Candidatus Peregrinibacteria bacterium]